MHQSSIIFKGKKGFSKSVSNPDIFFIALFYVALISLDDVETALYKITSSFFK